MSRQIIRTFGIGGGHFRPDPSCRWVLTSGWFWLTVITLAVNDRVLKASYPGLVTGKLSDFAGVAMLALLGAALVGRRWPVMAVGVAFTALKTIPGIADAAVPVLGGRTLTDATDLVAVGVLAPVWVWLGRSHIACPSGDRQFRRQLSGSPDSGLRIALATGAMAALQVLGVGAAIATTTATSCDRSGETGVTNVVFDTGRFLAYSNANGQPDFDGGSDGRTWTRRSFEPDAQMVEPEPLTMIELDSGTTVRLGDQRVIETDPGGSSVTAFRYTESELNAQLANENACTTGSPTNGYRAVATDGDIAVVAMGSQGALVRSATGVWEPLAVGPYEPMSTDTFFPMGWPAVVVILGSLLAFVASIVIIARSGITPIGLWLTLITVGGLVALGLQFVAALFVVVFEVGYTQDFYLMWWCLVGVAFWMGTLVFARTMAKLGPRKPAAPGTG